MGAKLKQKKHVTEKDLAEEAEELKLLAEAHEKKTVKIPFNRMTKEFTICQKNKQRIIDFNFSWIKFIDAEERDGEGGDIILAEISAVGKSFYIITNASKSVEIQKILDFLCPYLTERA